MLNTIILKELHEETSLKYFSAAVMRRLANRAHLNLKEERKGSILFIHYGSRFFCVYYRRDSDPRLAAVYN